MLPQNNSPEPAADAKWFVVSHHDTNCLSCALYARLMHMAQCLFWGHSGKLWLLSVKYHVVTSMRVIHMFEKPLKFNERFLKEVYFGSLWRLFLFDLMFLLSCIQILISAMFQKELSFQSVYFHQAPDSNNGVSRIIFIMFSERRTVMQREASRRSTQRASCHSHIYGKTEQHHNSWNIDFSYVVHRTKSDSFSM